MNKKKALVGNAADEEQVKKADKIEKDQRKDELNDLRLIMSTRQGRRFIYRLVNEICHYDTDDAQPSGSFTYKSLGERNVGRIIKSDCCIASIEAYQLSEKENWKFLQGEK